MNKPGTRQTMDSKNFYLLADQWPELYRHAALAERYVQDDAATATVKRREGPVLGIVTKINRKSVIVLAEDGTKQYKVSPELLRPLHNVK